MTMLSCGDIAKHFGGIRALDGVGMKIEEGEILGLVGPNGSGKSTLINVLSGFYPADAGVVDFVGENILEMQPHEIAHRGVARTFQIPRPFPTMTVRENVAVSYMFGRRSHSLAEARDAAGKWIDFTDLAEVADAPVGQLTLHQLKFLELARALATEPKLLLLDEVLAGLNPSEIERSILMVRRIHEQGITLLIVEHVIRAVTSLSSRIVVLDQGRVIAEGIPDEVMTDPVVVSAYLGKQADDA